MTSDRKLQRILLFIAAIGVTVLLALWFVYLMAIGWHFSDKPSDWSDFGSYIGGTSVAILSLLSLIAVLYTIYIQTSVLRRSTVAQENAASHARLNALVTLQDHYQRSMIHQGELARLLRGSSGEALAHQRIGKLDGLLRETQAEIEKYHKGLVGS